jgi:putative intracellular protease/amidase
MIFFEAGHSGIRSPHLTTFRRAMRHLRNGLVTLIATAAILAPAALANADEADGLVNVYAEDIQGGTRVTLLYRVPISVAANVCGIPAAVLAAALIQGQNVTCTTQTTKTQKAWVSYQ